MKNANGTFRNLTSDAWRKALDEAVEAEMHKNDCDVCASDFEVEMDIPINEWYEDGITVKQATARVLEIIWA